MRSKSVAICWARDTAIRLIPRRLIIGSYVMGQKVDPYSGLAS